MKIYFAGAIRGGREDVPLYLGLVAEVTTPSLGVGFEIGRATECGRRVLCLFRPSSGRALSALVAGSDQATVREYQTVADAEKIFQDFFL